jgi:hypothetical protein
MNVPRWKSRLASIVGLDRFAKLSIYQKKASADKFLKAGDKVLIKAEWLDSVAVTIVSGDHP